MVNPLYATRAGIEANQLTSLNKLIAEQVSHNPFWTKRLSKVGLEKGVQSIDEFFQKCPLLTKADLVQDQREFRPFGSNHAKPLEAFTRFHQTSGTTGEPIRWLDTPEGWSGLVDNWIEVYRAAGVTKESRVYFAFSFGPFIGFWLAFDAAEHVGCLCLPGGSLTTGARLRAIFDNEVDTICCTPTYAMRLAESLNEVGLDPGQSKLKRVIVAGEPGGSILETRLRFESLWPGARFFDHHGMTEVGPVTFEAPSVAGSLQVVESGYLVEVIDPESTEPVPLGTSGELVITTLNRWHSPVLRYRTGDLVKAIEGPAPDGSHNRLLEGGILGRADDMVVVRGVNIHPSAVESVVRSLPQIHEYRVLVAEDREMTELRMEISVEGSSKTVAVQLEERLRLTFNLRFPVSVVPADALPKFEMKAKRWLRA